MQNHTAWGSVLGYIKINKCNYLPDIIKLLSSGILALRYIWNYVN
jgi:hypothetical protein